MKNIRDVVNTILDNFPAWLLVSQKAFSTLNLNYINHLLFILYFDEIVYSTLLLNYRINEEEFNKNFHKKTMLIMFALSFSITYFFGEPAKENVSSEIPYVSYQTRQGYYSVKNFC